MSDEAKAATAKATEPSKKVPYIDADGTERRPQRVRLKDGTFKEFTAVVLKKKDE